MSSLSTTLKEHFNQFLYTLYSIPEAIRFFRKNRLWEGFMNYGWVNKILIFLAVMAGIKTLAIVFDSIEKVDTSNAMALMSSIGNFTGSFFKNQWAFFTEGGVRYGILVLLEIFIFHVCHRAVDILMQDRLREPRFNDFIKAQVRILVLSMLCVIAENIVVAVVSPVISIMPAISWLEAPILFLIHCFFMGMLVLDNYNEIFELKIKQSFRYSLHFPGIALALGIVLRVCFYVPFIGPIVGTLLTAVTVSLVMFEHADLHKPDGHWREELV